MTRPSIPGPCPTCGAVSIAPVTHRSVLLAVCDVLVVKAMERVGIQLVRAERGRYHQRGAQPWHQLHTRWRPTDPMLDRALKDSWDVVPALMDTYGCGEVTGAEITTMLDEYARDLAITGTMHTSDELAHRFETRLGLKVFDHHLEEDHRHA